MVWTVHHWLRQSTFVVLIKQMKIVIFIVFIYTLPNSNINSERLNNDLCCVSVIGIYCDSGSAV